MDDEELKKKLEEILKKDFQLAFLEHSLPLIEKLLNYPFSNKGLLIQAFTRSSYAVEHGVPSNEILEFIGDKIIDIVVVKAIADKFGVIMPEEDSDDYKYFTISTNQTEKDFNEIKKNLVNNNYLASIIDMLKFDEYLLLGRSDIDNKVNSETKVKADLLEAIIGAIAIDSKWNSDVLKNTCNSLLSINAYLDQFKLPEHCDVDFDLENSISVLKELSEHGRCSEAIYIFGDTPVKSEDGTLEWSCACFIKSHHILVSSYASNKKIAKKYCAYSALCHLLKIKNKYMAF